MILARAYSPLGFYPVGALSEPEGIFILDDELIFSAAPEYDVVIEGYVPESIWINPGELRLLSAITLAVPYGYGKVALYPDVLPVRLNLETHKLTEPDLQEGIRNRLLDSIASARSPTHNPLFYKPVPQPPVLSGYSYRYNTNANDVEHQRDIFEAIDLDDHLMIRGLGALLKGELLSLHHIFHTEACMSLYVAMEASMEIIRRRLAANQENPGPEDASRYLAEAFGNQVMQDRYFGEYYDDRIRTVHPDNRFGAFPYAPLMADDYFDLYDQLRSVYDFLLTGRIDPAFSGH